MYDVVPAHANGVDNMTHQTQHISSARRDPTPCPRPASAQRGLEKLEVVITVGLVGSDIGVDYPGR